MLGEDVECVRDQARCRVGASEEEDESEALNLGLSELAPLPCFRNVAEGILRRRASPLRYLPEQIRLELGHRRKDRLWYARIVVISKFKLLKPQEQGRLVFC